MLCDPTLIAGDRSLENVIAHEIIHSWTGNLVTHLNYEHFWLNEGWTRFIENKVMGKLRGSDCQELDIANSQIDLKLAVDELGKDNEFTKLNCSLKDQDPDVAFSSIPYEKGSEFLRYLEDVVGGDTVFDQFIKAYIQRFRYKCLDSDEFKDFLWIILRRMKIKNIDWELWLRGKGMAPKLRKVESKMINDAQNLVKQWSDICGDKDSEFKASSDDIKDWSVDQLTMFLDDVLKNYQDLIKDNKLTKEQIKVKENKMKEVYKFNKSKNAEILFRFNLIALECDDESQYDSVKNMLSSVGRMKFVRPTFRALIKNETRKKIAQEIYQSNKNFYHPFVLKWLKIYQITPA